MLRGDLNYDTKSLQALIYKGFSTRKLVRQV